MTQAELFAALETLGMPAVYGEFESTEENPAPDPPYITIQYAYSSDLKADNQNYMGIGNYQVELYTQKKDQVKESLIETLFKANRLSYSKIEKRLDPENMRQVIYEIQLIGG